MSSYSHAGRILYAADDESKATINSVDRERNDGNALCLVSTSNADSTTVYYHDAAPSLTIDCSSSAERAININYNVLDGSMRSLPLIVDVSFIFLSGIAFILGLIVLVYISVVVFDRYFGCTQYRTHHQDDDEGNWDEGRDLASPHAYGPVAFKARLWGLTRSERRAVLEQVYERHIANHGTRNQRRVIPIQTISAMEQTTTSRCEKDARDKKGPLCLETSSLSSAARLNQSVLESFDLEEATEEGDSLTSKYRCRTQIDARIGSSLDADERHGMETDSDQGLESAVDFFALDDDCVEPTCAICLGEYEEDDKLLFAMHCSHLYHYECIMQWMEQQHDHCPCCRVEMVTPGEMRRAAIKVFDKQRIIELSRSGRKRKYEAERRPSRPPFLREASSSESTAVFERSTDFDFISEALNQRLALLEGTQ